MEYGLALEYATDNLKGNAGIVLGNGVLFVITELAPYSLKGFPAQRRDRNKPFSLESVRNMCKAMSQLWRAFMPRLACTWT